MEVQNKGTFQTERTNTQLGPYRATKLWNDVLRNFRQHQPVGRHRRYMKSYDSCFVASDAVSWLHSHLRNNQNFGPSVTRQQTVLLLQKFHKALVFEDVRATKHFGDEFADNGRLYRFLPESPSKPVRSLARTPLAQRTSLINKDPARTNQQQADKDNMKKPIKAVPPAPVKEEDDEGGFQKPVTLLSPEEVEEVWRTLTLNRLQEMLSLDTISEVMEPHFVNTSYIIHNMTQVNKNGIVSNIDKKDQMPDWVLTAMRCLAYWPDKVDDYPDYPGFEKDVFKVVKDYFEGLKEPLTTFAMYEVFMNVMVRAENLCGGGLFPPHPSYLSPHQSPVAADPQPHLTSFASVENLMLNLTMNATSLSSDLQPREIMIVHDQATSSPTTAPASNVSSRGSASIDKSSPVPYSSDDAGYCSNSESSVHNYSQRSQNRTLPNGYTIGYAKSSLTLGDLYSEDNKFIDHSFSRERSASVADVHKNAIIPENNLSQSNRAPSSTNICDPPSANRQTYGFTVVLSTTPKTDQDFVNHANNRRRTQSGSNIVVRNDPDYYSSLDRNFMRQRHHSHRPSDPPPYIPPPSYNQALYSSMRSNSSSRPSPANLSSGQRVSDSDSSYSSAKSHLSPDQDYFPSNRQQCNIPARKFGMHKSAANLTESYRMAVDNHGPYSTPVGKPLFAPSIRRSESSPNLTVFKPNIEERILESLQVCLLLLPPANRRTLHLLLRLMHKMVNNDRIDLNSHMSTKKLLLQTFSRCILRSQEEADYDEVLTTHAVAFMVEHYQALMRVPTPLRRAIEARLQALKRSKPPHFLAPGSGSSSQQDSPVHAPTITFCSQVSVSEYEKQGMSASQMALVQLLDNIVKDKQMSTKEKKRRLKQFQKNHPDIYKKRFPTHASESELFPNKPRIKPPLLTKPLQRLKNLRL